MYTRTVKLLNGFNAHQTRRFKLIVKALGVLLFLNLFLTWLFPPFLEREVFAQRTVIHSQPDAIKSYRDTSKMSSELNITVATVACGYDHLQMVTTMIKTAILFSVDANLHVIVFTDEETIFALNNALNDLKHKAQRNWVGATSVNFTYELQHVWFPSKDESGVNWMKLHMKCTNQRLFFPQLLPKVDALIYLDTDVLVFGSLTDMWLEFSKMNERQVAAAAQNAEFLHVSMYDETKGHPYFGPRGLNAGIMLMNLTRMRKNRIQERAIEAYKSYYPVINFADQDILNIVFAETPNQMYTLSCIYNFMWVHCPWKAPENEGKNICRWMSTEDPACFCHDIYTRGLYIIHGNYGSFYHQVENTTNLMFPWIFSIIEKYKFGDNLDKLLMRLYKEYPAVKCWMESKHLIQNALNYFTFFSLFH